MKAIFMGTPDFALPVLEALVRLGLPVAAVYTGPDRPRGRGLREAPSPVKQWAQACGLQVLQPVSLRRGEAQQEMAAIQPDVIVVAAYGKILPREVLEIPPKGCLNIHPSLLPLYRGPSPVVTALLDGAQFTGVSLMLLDEGMDTGPLLAQQEEPILRHDTAESLTQRLFQKGAELLEGALPGWFAGNVLAWPQDDSRATVTRLVRREDGEADWRLSAAELERKVRAYTPWPSLYTRWKGKLLKVLEATVVPGDGRPGLVVPLEQAGVPCGVATGQGVLGLRRVLLEGKRALSSTEFVRGYRDFIGSELPC